MSDAADEAAPAAAPIPVLSTDTEGRSVVRGPSGKSYTLRPMDPLDMIDFFEALGVDEQGMSRAQNTFQFNQCLPVFAVAEIDGVAKPMPLTWAHLRDRAKAIPREDFPGLQAVTLFGGQGALAGKHVKAAAKN